MAPVTHNTARIPLSDSQDCILKTSTVFHVPVQFAESCFHFARVKSLSWHFFETVLCYSRLDIPFCKLSFADSS